MSAMKMDLRKLMADTEEAITAVKQQRDKISGAINWAALYCVDTAFVRGWDGFEEFEYYQTTISEVAPDEREFSEAIGTELLKLGWAGVAVITEW